MAAKTPDSMAIWPKNASDLFKFWISLWPVAPLFGVKWRFAGTVSKSVPGMMFGDSSSASPKSAAMLATPPPPKPGMPETNIDTTAEDAVEVKAAMEPPTAQSAAPEPAATEPAATEPAEAAAGDNELTRVKGIGPAVAKQLNDVGITRLAELASLTDDQVAALDAGLPGIKGRCSREDWVGQAKALVG